MQGITNEQTLPSLSSYYILIIAGDFPLPGIIYAWLGSLRVGGHRSRFEECCVEVVWSNFLYNQSLLLSCIIKEKP